MDPENFEGSLLPGKQSWSQQRQDVAAVLWPSFLVAAGASLMCFAFLDPATLQLWPAAFASGGMGRMTGYALGFFFFWLVAALSSAITLYLVRTAPEEP